MDIYVSIAIMDIYRYEELKKTNLKYFYPCKFSIVSLSNR